MRPSLSTTTLEIGDLVVLRSEGGAPEAEYALFDAADIELRATEVGAIREVAYRTAARDALGRLEQAGFTRDFADAAATAFRAAAMRAYARGPAARKAIGAASASELFDGFLFDAGERRYQGLLVDAPAVAADLQLAGTGAVLQAIALSCMLRDVGPDAPVVLHTLEQMLGRRPGERSYRRVSFRDRDAVAARLGALATRTPPPRDIYPTRTPGALLAAVRARPTSPERLAAFEQALAAPEAPPRGPLADPHVFAIERALSAGDLSGVLERIDALEQRMGRSPATLYLRGRASLLLGLDAPFALAERVSQLAMTHSFPELELLAAQAWLSANEPGRALPFARSVVANPSAPPSVRELAEDIVIATPAPANPPSVVPSFGTTPPLVDASPGGAPTRRPSSPGHVGLSAHGLPPAPHGRPGESREADGGWEDAIASRMNDALVGVASPSARPLAPADAGSSRPAPAAASASLTAAARLASSLPAPPPPSPPRGPVVGGPSSDTGGLGVPRSPSLVPTASPMWARGASMPAFRPDEDPAALVAVAAASIPRPARLPDFEPGHAPELAETLSLPAGLHGTLAADETAVPRTPAEARVQFTLLSRELGREYRQRHHVELRADIAGIELMQRVLRERFPDHLIRTREEALIVRRHGAFLSEIVARTLGGEWTDIAPTELGYWAMRVPPAARVWPFGRVLRLILMGHKERDLVSYYLELHARAVAGA